MPRSSCRLRPAAATAPGSSCRAPCRRPGRRRARASDSRCSHRTPTCWYGRKRRLAAPAPGSTSRQPSGARSAFSVSASHGPARRATSRRRRRRASSPATVGAGQQAHRLGEGQPVLARPAPPPRGSARIARSSRSRSTSTHRPRSSASAVGAGEQVADLRGGQRLAVERHVHAGNRAAPSRPSPDGGLAPTVRRHLRARRTVRRATRPACARPRRRLPGRARLVRSCKASRGRPAQRMKDLARIDHRP